MLFGTTNRKLQWLIAMMVPAVTAMGASADGFVVKHIDIQGLQRVSPGMVYGNIPIESGHRVTSKMTSTAIEDLYASGNFSDVRIYRQGQNVVIRVQERPAISEVNFSGNDEIKSKDLKKALHAAGLESGNIYDPQVLEMVKQSMQQQYHTLGKYAVKIDTEVVPLARNRVNITINISEGKTSKIARINFLKNDTYSQDTLRSEIPLTTPSIWNLWGLLTSGDQYSIQRMKGAVEKLRSFYMDRGYLNFHVDSSQVQLNPDKDKTFITLNLNEGDKYKVTSVSLEGEFVLPKDKLRKMIKIQPGDTFSRQKVVSAAEDIKYTLGNEGYAFANVNPLPEVDEKNHEVELVFYVDPGKKVYVRRVNFLGNNVTNDVVYRQHMLYAEGGMYNQQMIEESKMRLQRLPYVKKVDMKKDPVSGTDDMVDLNYNIEERSANSISANVGFSQLYGFMLGGNLGMPNVLGTGNEVDVGAQVSVPYKSINASYSMPYFTDSGISQTISAHLTNLDTADTTLADYTTNSYGADLEYIIPVSLHNSINVGAGYENTHLLDDNTASYTVHRFVEEHGDVYNRYSFNLGFIRNTTDRAFFPTSGNYLNVNTNIALPFSTLTWYKVGISDKFYYPVYEDVTLSMKGGVQYGDGYGNTDHLPFFNNFIGGGWGSVRGFWQGGLGPRDTIVRPNPPAGANPSQVCQTSATECSAGNNLGGNLNIYANLDLLFPVPGMSDKDNMRLGVFVDGGNVYSTYDVKTAFSPTGTQPSGKGFAQPTTPTLSNMVYSAGVEFLWISPMGPLSFSIAKPMNAQPGDRTQIFQFNLGQTF